MFCVKRGAQGSAMLSPQNEREDLKNWNGGSRSTCAGKSLVVWVSRTCMTMQFWCLLCCRTCHNMYILLCILWWPKERETPKISPPCPPQSLEAHRIRPLPKRKTKHSNRGTRLAAWKCQAWSGEPGCHGSSTWCPQSARPTPHALPARGTSSQMPLAWPPAPHQVPRHERINVTSHHQTNDTVTQCVAYLPNRSGATAWCKICGAELPKVLRACQFLTILTSKSLWRHSVVRLLSTSLAADPAQFPFFGTDCASQRSEATKLWKNTAFRAIPTRQKTLMSHISTVKHLCYETSVVKNLPATSGNPQYI